MDQSNKIYCQYKNCYKPALYVYTDRFIERNKPYLWYKHALKDSHMCLMVKHPICEKRQCMNIATHLKKMMM
jgi:hypothetical protein